MWDDDDDIELLPEAQMSDEQKHRFKSMCYNIASYEFDSAEFLEDIKSFFLNITEKLLNSLPSGYKVFITNTSLDARQIIFKIRLSVYAPVHIPYNPDSPRFRWHEGYVYRGDYIGIVYAMPLYRAQRGKDLSFIDHVVRKIHLQIFDFIMNTKESKAKFIICSEGKM